MRNTDYAPLHTHKPYPRIPENEASPCFAPECRPASLPGMAAKHGLRDSKMLSASRRHNILSRVHGFLALATCLSAYTLPLIGMWIALRPIIL